MLSAAGAGVDMPGTKVSVELLLCGSVEAYRGKGRFRREIVLFKGRRGMAVGCNRDARVMVLVDEERDWYRLAVVIAVD